MNVHLKHPILAKTKWNNKNIENAECNSIINDQASNSTPRTMN